MSTPIRITPTRPAPVPVPAALCECARCPFFVGDQSLRARLISQLERVATNAVIDLVGAAVERLDDRSRRELPFVQRRAQLQRGHPVDGSVTHAG